VNEVSAPGAPTVHPTASAKKARRFHPKAVTSTVDSIRRARTRVGALASAALGAVLAAPAPAAAHASPSPCGLEPLRRQAPAPFSVGEELAFRLTFAGAYVGHFEAKVGSPRTIDGRRVLPLFGRARTNTFVASFQPMSGRYMAMVDPETLTPYGLQTELEYGEDDRWEKVRFTQGARHVRAEFRVRGDEHTREYAADHDLTDILTLLYMARTIELRPGTTICQDVFSARRLWRMTARVVGVEDVKTIAGQKRAYHVKLHFLRKPHPTLRKNDPPEYDLDVFLSADPHQAPLEFSLRYEGAKAAGQLESWRMGR